MPHGITQCYLPQGRGDIPALVPAHLSSPGQRAVKRVCVRVEVTGTGCRCPAMVTSGGGSCLEGATVREEEGGGGMF